MASSENLWDKFLTYDNFLPAWQKTVNVTSRMIIDELGFQIFAFNLEANLKDLIRQVQAEDFPYTPLADHKVYVPKPSTTLRTMSFHQFAHLTLIAFYEYTFPSESGLHDGYASLTDRKVFTTSLPNGCETWKELGSMRNRVDHPVDKKTKSHSKKITIEETEFFCKKLNVALQEIFNFWLNSSPTSAPTTSITVSTT